MKNKISRILSVVLLVLILVHSSACNPSILPDLETDSNGNVITTDDSDKNESSKSIGSGNIWEALKTHSSMTVTKFLYADKDLEGYPIPLTFLQEEGLVYFNKSRMKYLLNNELQASDTYRPFTSYAFVDPNTNQNDVYLILQFKSDNANNSSTWLATWQLKYTLADDDYQTFLNLQDDWRIRLFVQEMDKQYEPEVISKSVILEDLLMLGSHVRNEHWTKKSFPYIFATNVDYNNQIVTFAGFSDEGIRYFDVDMRKTNAWDAVITQDGLTEEERENAINIETMPTVLGDCLSRFDVRYKRASLTAKQSQEAFNNPKHTAELTSVNINQKDNSYTYDELFK